MIFPEGYQIRVSDGFGNLGGSGTTITLFRGTSISPRGQNPQPGTAITLFWASHPGASTPDFPGHWQARANAQGTAQITILSLLLDPPRASQKRAGPCAAAGRRGRAARRSSAAGNWAARKEVGSMPMNE